MNITLELDIGLNNNNIINNRKSNIKVNKENLQINLLNINNEKFLNNSFSDLSLSDIGNKEIPSKRGQYKNNENENINNYILNDIEKRSSLGSVKLEDLNNIFFPKNKKIKLTKEDLNNIPLPIFSCIYCSNEKISFNHFSQEILSNKYSLLSSIYDIRELNKILSNKYLIDKDDKNDKLENIIIKNTEYINKYYNNDEIKNFFVQKSDDDKTHFEMYQKKYIQNIGNKLNKIKMKKIKKNIYKIPSLPKKFNQCHSFNNNINNLINNSSINNSTDRLNEIHFNNNNNKNIQNNINQTVSNLSVSNFNSVSFINYIDNYFPKEKENRFKLDDIIEQIEKNSNIEYSGFDLSRKIKREDIEWDNEYYNIWTPIIEPVFLQYAPITKKSHNKTNNKTIIKLKKGNTTFYKKIKKILTLLTPLIKILLVYL